MNLLVNAREAMPEGGRITLELLSSREAALAVPDELDPALDFVVLRVSDTGVGMDEAIQANIFDPYFTTKPTGNGLGLSTSYGIVKQSGGALTVTSSAGHGAVFSVFLPRAAGPAPARREAIAGRASMGRKSVLRVDDQADLRRTTRILLEAEGYLVIEAVSPEGALAIAEKDPRPIDLLLTDVLMPKINGLELAQKIRALRPAIRVLYVSGWADQRLMAAKDAPLLPKPFTSKELADAVADALGERPGTTSP